MFSYDLINNKYGISVNHDRIIIRFNDWFFDHNEHFINGVCYTLKHEISASDIVDDNYGTCKNSIRRYSYDSNKPPTKKAIEIVDSEIKEFVDSEIIRIKKYILAERINHTRHSMNIDMYELEREKDFEKRTAILQRTNNNSKTLDLLLSHVDRFRLMRGKVCLGIYSKNTLFNAVNKALRGIRLDSGEIVEQHINAENFDKFTWSGYVIIAKYVRDWSDKFISDVALHVETC